MNNDKHKKNIPHRRAILTHMPISEHVPLLEYRCTEVNCNIDIDAPSFVIIYQNLGFQL